MSSAARTHSAARTPPVARTADLVSVAGTAPAQPPGTIGFVLSGAVPAGSGDLTQVLDVVEAVRSLAVDALPGAHTTAAVTLAGDPSTADHVERVHQAVQDLRPEGAPPGSAAAERAEDVIGRDLAGEGLVVDLASRRVSVGGGEVTLTYLEFELLVFLVEHGGRVFSRAQLLRHVWGYEHVVGGRTVDVHVKRLRSKLGADRGHRIETVRGVGYRSAGEARVLRPGEPLRTTG
jgi:DNA-binding winged helix-turn-helix (wHTH) protein